LGIRKKNPKKATLEAIGGTPVPTSRIIGTDYVGDGQVGSVTFWVDSLSVYGIGSPGGGGTASSSSGGGGYFIATALSESSWQTNAKSFGTGNEGFLFGILGLVVMVACIRKK